ncbi:unnamed protein product, partial [Didymodactylos carnosus]
ISKDLRKRLYQRRQKKAGGGNALTPPHEKNSRSRSRERDNRDRRR